MDAENTTIEGKLAKSGKVKQSMISELLTPPRVAGQA